MCLFLKDRVYFSKYCDSDNQYFDIIDQMVEFGGCAKANFKGSDHKMRDILEISFIALTGEIIIQFLKHSKERVLK